MYSNEQIQKVCKSWGFSNIIVRRDIDIQGSPFRTEYRTVFETKENKKFILEAVSSQRIKRKKRIVAILTALEEQKQLNIYPYLKVPEKNESHVFSENVYWQCSPFIEGTPLKRPDYVKDAWRGKITAEYLVLLKTQASFLIRRLHETECFSYKEFSCNLYSKLSAHKPDIAERLKPVIDFLKKDFFKEHDKLPLSFCHGDFHVMNIIWGERNINAVIDWEFAGERPEIYDAANLIGCIGIEDPDFLFEAMARTFISSLKEKKFFSENSFRYFVEYCILFRFGWLSEWLLLKDEKMIDMELVYMHILKNNIDVIKKEWGLAGI